MRMKLRIIIYAEEPSVFLTETSPTVPFPSLLIKIKTELWKVCDKNTAKKKTTENSRTHCEHDSWVPSGKQDSMYTPGS